MQNSFDNIVTYSKNAAELIKHPWRLATSDIITELTRGQKTLLDGFETQLTAMPQFAKAQIQTSNAAIDKINNELAARALARAKAETEKKIPTFGKTKQQEEREKWLKPGGFSGPAGGAVAGAMATQQKIEFVGMSQLAEKMQMGQNDIAQEHLGVAKNQIVHMAALAGCVQNGGLNVNVPTAGQQQHWGT